MTLRAQAVDLPEPPVLDSVDGVLDVLMVAKPASVPALAPFDPTGWVYEICRRSDSVGDRCPPQSPPANYYGGTNLHLNPGDTLKVHLVNALPIVTDSEHAREPGEQFLALNPTNLHTHGMLVSTHTPTPSDPTYGDNVFVLTFNSANGQPAPSPHMHAAVRYDSTDYSIQLPADHPSGLFWFHPHAHGLALNQVSAGLTGIITVGGVGDYVCVEAGCPAVNGPIGVRNMILKDTQILANGSLLDQEDPDFCTPATAPAPGSSLGQGSCPGQDQSSAGGGNYKGGRWYFTINGQPFANVPVTAPAGEIWRIVNTSGSVGYNLDLWNPDQQRQMVMQVLSVDGVGVSPAAGTTTQQLAQMLGPRLQPIPCPGLQAASPANPAMNEPLCTRSLRMMPSSRVEIWVNYRDGGDAIAAPPAGAGAILRTTGLNTGPVGDSWPPVDLASVQFLSQAQAPAPASLQAQRSPADLSSAAFAALSVKGQASALRMPSRLAQDMKSANAAIAPDPSCAPLAPGHMRRIFFNAPVSNPDAFGLGYEEIDAAGVPVPGTFQDVAQFDPRRPTVCVPLGPGNTAVTERWQLVNLAGEDHNFHLHQTHFRIVTDAELGGTSVPGQLMGDGVLLDNVPLVHADGVCNSVQDWREGACTAHPAMVEIPFAIAGDFVYHCHILEHEDGGMMARIRVRPNAD